MKAIVYTNYGPPDVLQLREVPTPSPREEEILVRVHATPVNFGDITARDFKSITPTRFTMPLPLWLPARLYFGWSTPKIQILGNEFAGEVVAIGKAVTRFKPGDQVFGYRGQSMGAYAEYLCVSENSVVAHKPAGLSFEEAAVIPYGSIMALNLLKKANISRGQSVLILGASGGIGSFALQLARYYGAEVTGVCSAPRMALVKSLGAYHVIDYTREDFTQDGKTYNLIFDILGKSSFTRCKGSLKPNGIYLLASFKMKHLFQMFWTSIVGGKKVLCGLAPERAQDLVLIKELVEAGKIKAIIDRRYPLEQTAEAHRYVETGLKQAGVVITI